MRTVLAALLGGTIVGLGLRLALFLLAANLVRISGQLAAAVLPSSAALDPVYTRAALRSLTDLHIQGLAAAGPLVLRAGWRHHRKAFIAAGLAVQLQVALGILGAPPSLRELEATGVSFAANALLPWLIERGGALSNAFVGSSAALASPILVGLALLIAYLPAALVVLLR